MITSRRVFGRLEVGVVIAVGLVNALVFALTPCAAKSGYGRRPSFRLFWAGNRFRILKEAEAGVPVPDLLRTA